MTADWEVDEALLDLLGAEHSGTRGDDVLFSGLTITFLKEFGMGLWLSTPLWLSLAAVITLFGQVAGKIEVGRGSTDSTGFSSPPQLGYGDVRPAKRASKGIAILIALMGLSMTGILIAVAVHAATFALAAHDAAAGVR